MCTSCGRWWEGKRSIRGSERSPQKEIAFANSLDINERHVSLSALDPADVGTIQAANVGKLFLGHT